MSATTTPPTMQRPPTQPVAELVDSSLTHGERDVFLGKRQWVRCYLGARLEVTADPHGKSGLRRAVMHNISGGGMGFWSAEPFDSDAVIYIRHDDDTRSQPQPWIEARVMHCSLGIRGHLIGVAFKNPLRSLPTELTEQGPADRTDADAAPRAPEPAPRRAFRWSATLAAAVGGALGAAVGVWIAPRFGPGALFFVPTLAALALAGAFAWCALYGPVALCRALADQLRALQEAETTRDSALPVRYRELAPVTAAVEAMRSWWRTRENDERAQRQRLEELNLIKSNILNMVSHDLRTPLTSIRLYAQMLEEGLKQIEHDDERRFVGIIQEECDRLARLVDDLLEAQRLEAGRARWNMQSQDPARLIRGCNAIFKPLAEAKSMNFRIDCPETLPPIECDADKISQVLSNLVSNALKYTPDGGEVCLSATASTTEVLICVADNGPGIPRDKWDYIFDRFAQVTGGYAREIGGVGLGLFIVRQIVERHGGRVWVESEVGKGSSFYVALPIEKPATGSEPDEAPPPPRGRVLLCDADPELSARITQLLRRDNYDVRTIHSGCRLLAQVVELQPDVVLTDLLLPDIDAGDLLVSLLEMKQRHRFAIVAHTFTADGPVLREEGVDVVINRPAYPEELRQAVRVALRRTEKNRSVLLVGSDVFTPRAVADGLAAQGQTPLIAAGVEHLRRLLRDYPIDSVVISAALLADEPALAEPIRAARPRTNLFCVAAEWTPRLKRAAADLNAVAVTHRPGAEAELVGQIIRQSAQNGGVA